MKKLFRKLIDFVLHSSQRGKSQLVMRKHFTIPEPHTDYVSLNYSETDIEELPEGVTVQFGLDLHGCTRLRRLPENLRLSSLNLAGCTSLECLPEGLTVQLGLNLQGCTRLRSLPDNLRVGSLNVAGCVALERLPEGLSATFLDISDCDQLEDWPRSGSLSVGRLRARYCLGLQSLPPWLGRISQLDLAGCAQIEELPSGLEVSSWIDVAGTGIRALPDSLAGVGLRWRGVIVDERIAFRPEEITAQEVLDEPNAELRRVKMERMGFERFLAAANPNILDTDRDPGGERKLFRVEIEGDEPLVCVSVGCPSTGRRYLLRVPPETTTCRQAIAWTAGFDNPDEYAPLVET